MLLKILTKSIKSLIISLAFIACSQVVFAQDFLPTLNDNYMGINQVFLQPASIAGSPLKIDINIAGFSNDIFNDGMRFRSRWILYPGQIVTNDNWWDENTYLPPANEKEKNMFMSQSLVGPSFMISPDKNARFAYGFTSRVRSITNMDQMDEPLFRLMYSNYKDSEYYNKWYTDESYMRATQHIFGDYGLTFAWSWADPFKINGFKDYFIKVGGTLKLVQGIACSYLQTDELSYYFNGEAYPASKDISWNSPYVQAGISDNWGDIQEDGSYNFSMNYQFTAKPSIGADLGFVFVKLKGEKPGKTFGDLKNGKVDYSLYVDTLPASTIYQSDESFTMIYIDLVKEKDSASSNLFQYKAMLSSLFSKGSMMPVISQINEVDAKEINSKELKINLKGRINSLYSNDTGMQLSLISAFDTLNTLHSSFSKIDTTVLVGFDYSVLPTYRVKASIDKVVHGNDTISISIKVKADKATLNDSAPDKDSLQPAPSPPAQARVVEYAYTEQAPFTEKKQINYNNTNYWFKIGVSLLDIGHLTYEKDYYSTDLVTSFTPDYRERIADNNNEVPANTYWFNAHNLNFTYQNYVPFSQEMHDRMTKGEGVYKEVSNKEKFYVKLPFALSLQADFSLFLKGLYLNVTTYNPLLTGNERHIPNSHYISNVSITPRFEHKWWGVSVPIQINKYHKVSVGLAGRAGVFYFGVNNFISNIFSDTYSINAYVGVKIPIYPKKVKEIPQEIFIAEKDTEDGDDYNTVINNIYSLDTIRPNQFMIFDLDPVDNTYNILEKFNESLELEGQVKGEITGEFFPNERVHDYFGCLESEGSSAYCKNNIPKTLEYLIDQLNRDPNSYDQILKEILRIINGEDSPSKSKEPLLEEKTSINPIKFEFDKYELNPEGKAFLDLIAIEMQSNNRNLEITGYTDNQGTNEYNNILSDKRANQVKAYLISKGIDSGRLKANGLGESNPLQSNDTPSGREINRRVEFKYK